MMGSAVVRDTPVSVNIMRPDWLNTHTEFPAAHASCVNYAKHRGHVEIMLRYFAKCTKRVSSVTVQTKKSNIPDKRLRDGIDGEASVNVAIGGRH